MVDTYAGESYAKKVARCVYWDIAAKLANKFRRGGLHVVLASRECGDFPVAEVNGITNIVGAERSKEAFQLANAAFPGKIVLGDVCEYVESLPSRPAHVCLDFCGPLSTASLNCISRVAARMPERSVLGVAYLRGRDPDRLVVESTPFAGHQLRHAKRSGAPKMLVGSGLAEGGHRKEIADSPGARFSALDAALAAGCSGTKPRYVKFLRYMGHNSPMEIAIIEMLRGHPEPGSKSLQELQLDVHTLFSEDLAEEVVKRSICDGVDPRHFNISARVAAAWKAHKTMGTYDVARV